MKNLRFAFLLCAWFCLTPICWPQSKRITAAEAKDHVGQSATVCGRVVSARYAERSKGQPTFLNLDKPYPREIFTILIWGENRSKFGMPESKYRDAEICVTGQITSYRGTAEIVTAEPNQISSEPN
jgi:hypothetical protein